MSTSKTLPDDSLRFVCWAPDAIEAAFPDLDPSATYELEATYLCERHVRRVLAMTSRGRELHPPTELAPGTVTTVRVARAARGVRGRDAGRRRRAGDGPGRRAVRAAAVLVPAAGARDHRRRRLARRAHRHGRGAGLVGRGRRPGARDGRRGHDRRDDRRQRPVPRPAARRPAARPARATSRSRPAMRPATAELSWTRATLARGLRELPPASDRLDLGGAWSFRGGPFARPRRPRRPDRTTRVPGHVIYDGLVPEDGVATFQRTVDLPATWAGRAVFLRCDGAYGRAEVDVNGTLAGVHGSGATSFDVELTAVPPTRRQRPRDHADRVHAVRRARRHELVRPHVAARNLAGHPPVLRAAAPPRPARPRRRTGTPSREPARWRSAWTRSTSAARPNVSSSRRRSGTPWARSPGAARRAGRSTRRGALGAGSRPDPSECARGRPRSPCSTTSRSALPGTRASPSRTGGGSGSGGWRRTATGSSSTAPRSASAASIAMTRGSSRAARCPRTTCARMSSTCGARTSP